MHKPTKEMRFLQAATRCPVCFRETKNRAEIVRNGVVILTMPACSEEHLAITMKKVMQRLDPETRKHVKLQFGILN